jgi:hypothetical protein
MKISASRAASRYGVMHFGAAKGTGKPFDAHALLDAAGAEVTGYPVAKQFAEIACFV